jgi:hypothetical protein
MSEIQSILKALEEALHSGNIGEEMCYGLRLALDGIPEKQHMAAFKAMIGAEVRDAE